MLNSFCALSKLFTTEKELLKIQKDTGCQTPGTNGLKFFSKAKDLEKSLTFGRILYTIVVLSEIPYFSEETL